MEKLTTAKKSNLILNVDGAIATSFVDMVRSCGAFTPEEVDEAINVRQCSPVCSLLCVNAVHPLLCRTGA